MAEKNTPMPEAEGNRLKNPSPIGTQHNPVSNPDESENPVEKELGEREMSKREHEIERRRREKETD